MNNLEIEKISDTVKEKGVISIKDFLKQNDFDLINSHLLNLTKKSKKVYFPTTTKQYFIKFLKCDFKKIMTSKKLIQIAKDLKLKEIANNVFGQEANLDMLDCYLSKRSNNQILRWHNDLGWNPENHGQTISKSNSIKNYYKEAFATIDQKKNNSSGRGIKFFIYMTDIERNNGSLGIIPYSHKIVLALTRLILEKKVKLESYWKLEDLRNFILKKEVKNFLVDIVEERELESFLEYSKFIEGSNKDTHDFDCEMKKNSVVIFDELTVHRGSAPCKNDRLVLRYLYRKKL